MACPGPGDYYNPIKQTSFNPKPKNYKFQLFNSSMPRFENSTDNIFVGPGSYNPNRNGPLRNYIKPKNVGFNCEAPRQINRTNSPTNDSPGPGSYAYPYEISKISKKKHHNQFSRKRRYNSDMLSKITKKPDQINDIYDELENNIIKPEI